jgi:hypothetical protein
MFREGGERRRCTLSLSLRNPSILARLEALSCRAIHFGSEATQAAFAGV